MRIYKGAGILFLHVNPDKNMEVLLARRRSGIWSIPGGGRSRDDQDPWATASRETIEEFGSLPPGHSKLFCITIPLVMFRWETFVVELPHKPASFPDPSARDFFKEFVEASWFALNAPPQKTHFLLQPVFWKLRSRRFLGKH